MLLDWLHGWRPEPPFSEEIEQLIETGIDAFLHTPPQVDTDTIGLGPIELETVDGLVGTIFGTASTCCETPDDLARSVLQRYSA